jgi:6-phosphogluconolactonase (cycloisomerase 2 family)
MGSFMNCILRSRAAAAFLSAFLCVLIACGNGSSNSTVNTGGATPTSGGGTTTGSSNPGNTGATGSGTTGGGSGGPTSGGTTSATLSPPKFVYALDSSVVAAPGVQEFRIDPISGALTNIGFAEIHSNFPNGLIGMAATPVTGFLFVGDWQGKLINVLKADANSGQLTSVGTTSLPDMQGYPVMVTDPAGKFLFVSDSSPVGSKIWVFSIGSSGDLSAVSGSPFIVAHPLSRLNIDANGKFLFGTFDNFIYGFSIGSNGAITPTSDSPITVRAPFNTIGKGDFSVGAAIDPAGRYLFVGDSVNPIMHVYSVGSTGTLTEVQGSPFQIGFSGDAVSVDPLGKFVLVGSFSQAQVAALTINQATGAVSPAPGSPYDNGPFRNGGTPVVQSLVDPSGKFVLFDDSEETKITVFAIDQNTGALTNVPGSPFLAAQQVIGGGSPSAIAITH